MKIRTFIAIIILAVICGIGATVGAQQLREEYTKAIEARLFKASSAAYKLEAMYNGKGFQFCNTSKKQIKSYRLGCVKQKKNELLILSERDIETTPIKPPNENDGNLTCQFWTSNHGFFPVEECKKGKLAVIEVFNEDGTNWKLSN